MDKERLQKALDSLVYLPHLKEKALHTAVSPVGKDAGGKGRVWDRGDLFRRLQTYTAVSWFCKPDMISPTECARRGWLNTAPDILTCEFCRAKVSCPIPPQLLPEEAKETAARYAKQLTEAHDAACPWRTTCCAASLLQFPPLTQEASLEDFRKRAASLQQLLCLPPLAAEAYERIAAGSSQQALDQLLLRGPTAGRQQGQGQQQQLSDGEVRAALGGGVATWNADAYEVRLRLLALCGWDLKLVSAAAAAAAAAAGNSGSSSGRASGSFSGQGGTHAGPECSALTCTLCGAKAGLWTFFPSCRPQVQALPARGPSGISKAAPAGGHRVLGMATTIAGGVLSSSSPSAATTAAAAAGPFGSPPQQPLFGPPSRSAGVPGSRAFHNIAGGSVGLASPPASATETDAAALAAAGAAPSEEGALPAGPFGSGAAALGGMPVFGVAALHNAAPPGEAAKRKLPNAEAEAGEGTGGAATGEPVEKRSRAGDAEGGNGAGSGGAGNAASSPGPPLQYCSTEALRRYCTMEALPLDPLALHRAFCPWVCQGQGGSQGQPARCGWKWCLQQLVPGADDGSSLLGTSQGAGEGGKQWDPAVLLRTVLQKVDVHN